MIQRKLLRGEGGILFWGHLATNGKRKGIFDVELIRETIDSSVDDYDAILVAG